MGNHKKYWKSELELSSVGSIIVKDNIIISEGTTSNYGENHAHILAHNNK